MNNVNESDRVVLTLVQRRTAVETVVPMLAYVIGRTFNRKEEDVGLEVGEMDDRDGEPTVGITIDGSLIAYPTAGEKGPALALDRVLGGFDTETGPWEDFEPAGTFDTIVGLVAAVVAEFAAVAVESLLESYDVEHGGDRYANDERAQLDLAQAEAAAGAGK